MKTTLIASRLRPVVTLPLLRWLLGFKAVYFLALLGGLWLCDDFDSDTFYAVSARWPRQGLPVFASHFATWDAAHYLLLSEVGYSHGATSCAFYPLWPLAVRWSSTLTGVSHLLAGIVLSNLLSLVAWILF